MKVLLFNSRKRSGRNFGYMHPDSVFSHVGTAIFPDDMTAWPLIAYLNSRLVTYLKLAQTFERKWEVSTVASTPSDRRSVRKRGGTDQCSKRASRKRDLETIT